MCDCFDNVKNVEVLSLSENDIVVLTISGMGKLPKVKAEEYMKDLQTRLKDKMFPNNKLIILPDNTTIQVIKEV